MLVNKIHIFALAAALCTTATGSSANSSLFGDDLKNDEAVVLQLQTQLNDKSHALAKACHFIYILVQLLSVYKGA